MDIMTPNHPRFVEFINRCYGSDVADGLYFDSPEDHYGNIVGEKAADAMLAMGFSKDIVIASQKNAEKILKEMNECDVNDSLEDEVTEKF